jgi:outer membrane lipoprotein carrier protein
VVGETFELSRRGLPDLEQALEPDVEGLVAPLDETVGSSPALLLSGDGQVRDGFDVVESYTLDGLEWVKLAPKAGASDFTSVRIGFAGAAPQRLELVDGLNEVTRITLDNLVVNPEIDDATFEFDVPPGAEVSGEG